MNDVKGKVEKIEVHDGGRRRLKIRQWYSYFGDAEVKEGDYVMAEWELKGKFKTLTNLLVGDEPKEATKPMDDTSRLIVRQCCIKSACHAIHSQGTRKEHREAILELAEHLETWIYREVE